MDNGDIFIAVNSAVNLQDHCNKQSISSKGKRSVSAPPQDTSIILNYISFRRKTQAIGYIILLTEIGKFKIEPSNFQAEGNDLVLTEDMIHSYY